MLDLLRVPTDDRAWLRAALEDALNGGRPVQPISKADAPRPEGPLPEGTALVIHTTGSTGVPKFVALSAQTLRRNAEATHEALAARDDSDADPHADVQWLIPLPTHLIAGAQALVRSIVAGTRPVFLDGKFSSKKFIARARTLESERRYTSLVPVQLSRLVRYATKRPEALPVLQRFDAILVGGQSVPLALREEAHQLGLKVRRTYGMTETAGGVVYDGVEIGDTRVRIRGGEVQLAGSSLALGYIGDPEQTAERFVEDDGTTWFRTGDAGELLGGMLDVTGRIDRVAISGGVNVSLAEVERVAHENPAWTHAVAVPVSDEEWGQRVVLVAEGNAVVLREALPALAARIRETLGPAAEPIRVEHLDEFPRFENGKPDFETIAALIAPNTNGEDA